MMATHRHLRVAFLPGVRVILNTLKPKDYEDSPRTLGEHLKKRRRQLGLYQREAAKGLKVDHFTYINWEKGHTEPYAHSYPAIIAFLGYDPSPEPRTLAGRVRLKRQVLGVTFSQVAQYLGWDGGSLIRYLNGAWRLPEGRRGRLEAFLGASRDELMDIYDLPRRALPRARSVSSLSDDKRTTAGPLCGHNRSEFRSRR
jgi:transcriptional regulator with XRE-family HTH domain